MLEDVVEQFGRRLKYTHREMVQFLEKGHRIRHVERLSKAAPLYSIEAEVIKSRHCNSGHIEGQKFIMDIDGNFITKHCPKKMCVYLISQLTVPVALINERLSEGLEPNNFHFMRYVRCPDVGVECLGYGKVLLKVQTVSRVK
ncbi:MAG TPA: hypothetical protein VE912_04625 [Bacteroidales bacterium]|nr:hypothetical protein [Bacteroidales bacterium]